MCCFLFVCFVCLFCPIRRPYHHKCSRPPLDTTTQSQISSWLLMGCACLLQHGFYSVLDTNTAAALYTRAAVLFSCHAVHRGYTGPVYVPHSVWLRGIPFCCCIQVKQTAAIKAFIRMLLVWALTCLPLLFQCRGGGALWWSISMMDISFPACQAAHFNPAAPPTESGGITFWRFLCACAYWKCTTVYVHFSFVSNYLAPSLSSERKCDRRKFKSVANKQKGVCYKNNCAVYHFSATVSARHVQTPCGPEKNQHQNEMHVHACLRSCLLDGRSGIDYSFLILFK